MAISKDWWDAWWKADYSWDGLAEKEWLGWRVPIDYGGTDCGAPLPMDEVEDGAETRPANLQDYWRRAGISEADLIPMPGDAGKRFTLMHLPPHWPDGTSTEKADPSKPPQALVDLLKAELAAEIKNTEFFVLGIVMGADPRLQWQGAVLPRFSLNDLSPQTRTENGKIPISLHCAGAAFSGRADFGGADFSGTAYFGGAAFSGMASFKSAAFSDMANFGRAAFSDRALFESAAFSDAADFESAAFSGMAFFQSAAFSGTAGFGGAAFSGWADFGGAIFSDWAFFQSAAFSGRAFFQSAIFLRAAIFSGLARSVRSDPAEAELSFELAGQGTASGTLTNKSVPLWTAKRAFAQANFSEAQFFGRAAFDNRDFHTPANFDGAQFFRSAGFQGSDLHKGLSFTRADFDGALSPKARSVSGVDEDVLERLYAASPVPRGKTEKPDFDTWRKTLAAKLKTENNEAAKDEDRYFERVEDGFRSLKQIMEERRDRSAESRFFKLELKARRKRRDDQVPWWESPISWTFEALSDFGTSVFRPFICLFIFAGIFACLYQVMGGGAFVSADMLDTLRFSLSRVFPFGPWAEVDAASTIGQLLTPADDWKIEDRLPYRAGTDIVVSILAVLQSFLSAVLVFLSALAVRRRFQIN